MNAAEKELLCQKCSGEYPIWYCDHFLWDPIAERLEKDTGVSIHFLCLNCFAGCCREVVIETHPDCKIIWKLEVGGRGDAQIALKANT